MAQANVLLVVIGPTWTSCADDEGRRRIENPHDYVRLEVEAGLTNANVSVIPVLVGGTKMPSERSLPPALVPLARRNSLQLYDELWRPSLENLVEQLKRVRDETSASSGSGDASFFGELSAEAKVLGRQRWDTGQVEYDEDAITRDYEQPASFEERSSARDSSP